MSGGKKCVVCKSADAFNDLDTCIPHMISRFGMQSADDAHCTFSTNGKRCDCASIHPYGICLAHICHIYHMSCWSNEPTTQHQEVLLHGLIPSGLDGKYYLKQPTLPKSDTVIWIGEPNKYVSEYPTLKFKFVSSIEDATKLLSTELKEIVICVICDLPRDMSPVDDISPVDISVWEKYIQMAKWIQTNCSDCEIMFNATKTVAENPCVMDMFNFGRVFFLWNISCYLIDIVKEQKERT